MIFLLLVFMQFIIAPTILLGNPSGAQVVAGQVSVVQEGNVLTIQQGTDRAIVNWQDFSIGEGEITQFLQPGSTSAVLNRVTGGNSSVILGALQANGQVYLINPNGVLIGSSGAINTAGFVASTLGLDDTEFLSGGEVTFAGDSNATVINEGTIEASEGSVFLIAREVENKGVLRAPNGTVGLAGATEVLLFEEDGSPIGVRIISGEGRVENTGSIAAVQAELIAAGGNLYALAVNQEGVIEARGIENREGRIVLTAEDGAVRVNGLVDASSEEEGIAAGTILIGGDYQGKNSEVKNASSVYIDEEASIKADALVEGDGGRVIVWSDGTTECHGDISAQAFGETGDGGFVEVSGKEHLLIDGLVDLRSVNGDFGTLLLDPGSVSIKSGTGNSGFDMFTDGYINDQLALGNLTISTANASSGTETILLRSDLGEPFVDINWDSKTTLTLDAGENILGVATTIRNTYTGSTDDWTAIRFLANTAGLNNPDYGISLVRCTIKSAEGNIEMTGMGNYAGIRSFGSTISSVGLGPYAATISLTGEAKGYGVWLFYGALTSSIDGDIFITGISRDGVACTKPDGWKIRPVGVYVSNDAMSTTIKSTGTGANAATINIRGESFPMDSGTDPSIASSSGIQLHSARIFSYDGDISLRGTVQGNRLDPVYGIMVSGSSGDLISSRGTGANAANIYLEGEATNSSGTALDIYTVGPTGICRIGALDGEISLVGENVNIDTGSNIVTTGTSATDGTILLKADTLTLNGTIQGSGALFLQPYSVDRNILLGGTDANRFSLSKDEWLNLVDGFDRITVGLANGSHEVTIADIGTINDNLIVRGNQITVNNPIAAGTNDVTFYIGQTTAGTLNLNELVSAGTFTVNGGSFADVFNLCVAGQVGTFNGSGNLDELKGPNTDSIWNITGSSSGYINGSLSFHGIEILTGGSADDTLVGPNTDKIWTLGVVPGTGTLSGSVAFTGMENLVGGSGTDTLNGLDVDQYWTIAAGVGAGTLSSGVAFAGMENLTGGSGVDTFDFSSGGQIVGTVEGGLGADVLIGADGSSFWTLTGNYAGTYANDGSLLAQFNSIETLSGQSLNDTLMGPNTNKTWTLGVVPGTGTLSGSVAFTGMENLMGGSGTDTLNGLDVDQYWTIAAGVGAGTLSSGVAFAGMENLTGGSGVDTFDFSSGGQIVGTVEGGLGSDILIGADGSSLWTLTGNYAGTYANDGSLLAQFNSIETLSGQSLDDTLVGPNTDKTWTLGVVPGTGTLSGSVAFTGMESLIGGSGIDTLEGPDTDQAWIIAAGVGAGTLSSGVAFTGMENLTGGSGVDTFDFSSGGQIVGTVEGGLGSDILIGADGSSLWTLTGNYTGTYANDGSLLAQFNSIETLSGQSLNDTLVGLNTDKTWTLGVVPGAGTLSWSVAFTGMESLIGGSGIDTLEGPDTDQAWIIAAGVGAGTLSSGVSFTGMENLTGGSGSDTFDFSSGGQIVGTVEGGLGADILVGANGLSLWTLTGNYSGTYANDGSLLAQFNSIETLSGQSLDDTLVGLNTDKTWTLGVVPGTGTLSGSVAFTGMENLMGGSGIDTLEGPDADQTWTIAAGVGAGTLSSGISFTGMENLTGGSGSDTFDFSFGGQIVGTVDGGLGADIFVGADVSSFWILTGNYAGTYVNGWSMLVQFNSIETLSGQSLNDILVGPNTNQTWTLGVVPGTGTLSGSVAFTGMESLMGGSGIDTLEGPDADQTWTIATGVGAGILGTSVTFIEMENLTGGSGSDTFDFSSGGQIVGTVDGGLGADILIGANGSSLWTLTGNYAGTYANDGSLLAQFNSIETLSGQSLNDTLVGPNTDKTWTLGVVPGTGTLSGSVAFTGMENLMGGSGIDTLEGPDADQTWTIATGVGAGTLSGSVAFAGMENLTGGSGSDTFDFSSGGQIVGTVDGGFGTDILIGADGLSLWTLTGDYAGIYANDGSLLAQFNSIETLSGQSLDDILVGPNTDKTWTLGVVPGTGTLSGSVAFTGMENLMGGSGIDTLEGPNTDQAWTIAAGVGAGTLSSGISFAGMENLTGGSEADTFDFSSGGQIIGTVDGGLGADSLVGADGSSLWTLTGDYAGIYANDGCLLAQFYSIETLSGQSLDDTLVGPNVSKTWVITGDDAGYICDSVDFSGMENLTGGSKSDTFDFSARKRITGILNGGEGGDMINNGDSRGTRFNLRAPYEGTYHYEDVILADFISIEMVINGTDIDPLMIVSWDSLYNWVESRYAFLYSGHFATRNTAVIPCEAERDGVDVFTDFTNEEGFPPVRQFRIFNK